MSCPGYGLDCIFNDIERAADAGYVKKDFLITKTTFNNICTLIAAPGKSAPGSAATVE
jgi:hypothetical protein